MSRARDWILGAIWTASAIVTAAWMATCAGCGGTAEPVPREGAASYEATYTERIPASLGKGDWSLTISCNPGDTLLGGRCEAAIGVPAGSPQGANGWECTYAGQEADSTLTVTVECRRGP